jgi:hypothetical protein
MTRRDFVLVASTAAICSLFAFFAGATLTTAPQAAQGESSAASVKPAPASSEPAAQALGAAATPHRDSSRPDSEPPADDRKHQDPGLVIEKQKIVGETFSRLFKSGSPAAVNARVEERFYSEELNRDWAGNREGNIRSLFLANDDLRGMAPAQVACRSKNCQVVMSVASDTQVQELTQKFMRVATRSDIGMEDKLVSYFPDVAAGRLVFYLSENHNLDLFE